MCSLGTFVHSQGQGDSAFQTSLDGSVPASLNQGATVTSVTPNQTLRLQNLQGAECRVTLERPEGATGCPEPRVPHCCHQSQQEGLNPQTAEICSVPRGLQPGLSGLLVAPGPAAGRWEAGLLLHQRVLRLAAKQDKCPAPGHQAQRRSDPCQSLEPQMVVYDHLEGPNYRPRGAAFSKIRKYRFLRSRKLLTALFATRRSKKKLTTSFCRLCSFKAIFRCVS